MAIEQPWDIRYQSMLERRRKLKLVRDAAPELLEVLKDAIHDGRLQTFEDRDRFRQAAKKAIAKATGAP